MLNTSDAWSTKFTSSGTYSRHLVRFSLSGLPDADDLLVELDGVDLAWKPKEGLGVDRWHYDHYLEEALSDGEHEVKFTLINGEREGIAQLCSVEIIEFGDDDEWVPGLPCHRLHWTNYYQSRFSAKPGYYGIFPTSAFLLPLA